MAIKFIQEKEKQKTLTYIFIFLLIFFTLFLWRGVSFDFSAEEIPQVEDVVEIDFAAFERTGIERLRPFTIIPSFRESVGRSNPLLPSGASIVVDIVGDEDTPGFADGEIAEEEILEEEITEE